MATFIPLKRYMFYLLDRLIEQYKLRDPFLDIGCGTGDVAAYLGTKNWQGKAIDFSPRAAEMARLAVSPYPQITVEQVALADEASDGYQTILLWDVVEHIEDDLTAIRLAASRLKPGAAMLVAVPSNPREWRWDNEMVGHYRRYTVAAMEKLLREAGLTPVEFWDFTFPVFWLMRRSYTWLNLNTEKNTMANTEERTKTSAIVHAWHIPVIGNLLNRPSVLWRVVYRFQYAFRHATGFGHEFIALAIKPAN